jgi:hypothetical protein
MAAEPYLPLSALQPGMKGQGLTVFSGTKVEAFPIEVVGLLEGSGPTSQLILVKLTGGQTVAAGMSGSPIYVGGKLVGAIGYGFPNADARYAVVTPIGAMLSLLDYKAGEIFRFSAGSFSGYQGVVLGDEPSDGSWLRAHPVATPLFITSYRPIDDQCLLTTLQQYGFRNIDQNGRGGRGSTLIRQPLAVAPTKSEPFPESVELKPGSALTLILAEGDYKASALGTLTWRDGQEILGFGHSFLNKGWVEYGIGSASILGLIDSREFPFKIGVASSLFGRALQDRSAGVAGELDFLPQMVKVTSEVTAEDSGLVRDYQFTVVNDEELLPGLVLAGLMDTIDRTLDRIGPGTASIYFEINGTNFPSFQRENLFYGRDVAAAALREVGEMLLVLTENEFIHPELTDIQVKVEIDPEQRNAQVTAMEIPKKEFAPGENVTLTVNLQPFRREVVQIPIEIELPTTTGKWLIMVYGNENGFIQEEKGEPTGELYTPELAQSYSSLEEKLDDYRKRPQNNQLVVELIPVDELLEETVLTETLEEIEVGNGHQTITTAYFVTGEEQIQVEVVDPDEEGAPELPTIQAYRDF